MMLLIPMIAYNDSVFFCSRLQFNMKWHSISGIGIITHSEDGHRSERLELQGRGVEVTTVKGCRVDYGAAV